MRADIHGGPEQKLQSETGYIDARPLNASSTKPLATHGRTIHVGQTHRFGPRPTTSGLPQLLDIFSTHRHVSSVPKAESDGCGECLLAEESTKAHPVGVSYRRSTWNDLAVISQASFKQWYER